MAFHRPTLAELVDRSQQDFSSRLDLAGAVLRRSVVHVLARVVAGAAHMLHGHLEYLSKQLFPDQSDRPFLIRQASLFGIEPLAATFAEGEVTITGSDGSTVSVGSVLVRADGAEYESAATVTIESGTATLPVVARQAGADGTLEPGAQLTFESPSPGVNAAAEVAASTVRGDDQESTDSLRARLLARMQSPPHGGSVADYLAWVKEVPGVTRVWISPGEAGEGTVVVRFVRDDDEPISPQPAELAAVKAHLDEVRPVTAQVQVLAPVLMPLDLTLEIEPDTPATREAVRAELVDFLRRTAAPGETVQLVKLRSAAEAADGVLDCTVIAPIDDVPHEPSELAVVGTIDWTS